MDKNAETPHLKRLGRLKNGNKSGDFSKAPRCGAKGKRTGLPCMAPAMRNGKCRIHGGKSTGAKTKEGIQRIIEANLTHGRFTKEAIRERVIIRDEIKRCKALMNEMLKNELLNS